MQNAVIVVAGVTGSLGGLVADALVERGASVRGLVRKGSPASKAKALRARGITPVVVSYDNLTQLADACGGATCVVSALAGLRDVIVDAQTMLLSAAVMAGVPRFVPSDYCIDFTGLPPGTNRNLDLRREFHVRLDAAPIAATSVFCGMFADLLLGQAPVILFGLRRVVYWGDADQQMDFTTRDNTAQFTAAVALDDTTPRFLRIAGTEASARDLATIARAVTGERFRLFRPGGLGRFRGVIRFTRLVAPGADELYPPWQGMQYLHDMLDGRAKLGPLDNGRYPDVRWTPLREVLASR